MKQSPLHSCHLALGARLVPFAGWEMPIRYAGIMEEHRAVREGCGVFDISHMGELEVSGTGAGEWLDGLLCNRLDSLEPGQGQYSMLLNEAGGVIDDLIVYRTAAERYFLVVNASKTDEDLAWLEGHLAAGVRLRDLSADYAALAVQGPRSAAVWEAVEPGWPLPPRNGVSLRDGGREVLCRTGYTGEDGFELFVPAGEGARWWDRLGAAGAAPCGLGARDTLRLEKAYPLNGSDLDPVHTPLEAGLGSFVALDKAGGFVGREALSEQRQAGVPTWLSALLAVEKGPPPRPGYPLLAAPVEGGDGPVGEGEVARLSSGSLSPMLGRGIGLAYLPAGLSRPGTRLDLLVRGQRHPMEVVKKPFV